MKVKVDQIVIGPRAREDLVCTDPPYNISRDRVVTFRLVIAKRIFGYAIG